jgi:hypothetical protein
VTFSIVLDFAGVAPNPVRDKSVKLTREVRPEINPPSAEHVLAAIACCLQVSVARPRRWSSRLGDIVGAIVEQTATRDAAETRIEGDSDDAASD